MNSSPHRALRIALLAAAFTLHPSSFVRAQGSLTPPGAPAPTMKTLTEVEPRTAVSSTNTPGNAGAVFAISQSGSYYLTGDVAGVSGKNGINISGANVTLDLNGFNLVGVAGSANGIFVTASARVSISRGRLVSWPGHGITGANAGTSTYEDLVAESCGSNGFDLGDNARVQRCTARSNTSNGIRLGASGEITDCVANGNATGIEVNSGIRLSGCTAAGNISRGILVGSSGAVVTGNTVTVSSANALGILVSGLTNVIESNAISGTGVSGQVGLRVTGTANTVRDNLIRGTLDNYDIVTGNQLDLIVSQVPESIDWPANVRLAGSITGVSGQNGVTINADGVTLDLSGQELIGGGGVGTGVISTGSRRGVCVRNGAVRGWGSGGVSLTSCTAPQVTGVRASSNTGIGIATNGGAILDCTGSANTGAGISAGDNAFVSRCAAIANNGSNIIASASTTIADCTATGSTTGHGIQITNGNVDRCIASSNNQNGVESIRSRVNACTVSANGVNGVRSTFGGMVEHCLVDGNIATGILADAGGYISIRDNTVENSGAVGAAAIRVTSAPGCRVEGNSLWFNYRNLDVTSTGNIILRNGMSAPGAGGNFNIVAGNSYGPMVNVGGVGDITPTANSAHPAANYLY